MVPTASGRVRHFCRNDGPHGRAVEWVDPAKVAGREFLDHPVEMVVGGTSGGCQTTPPVKEENTAPAVRHPVPTCPPGARGSRTPKGGPAGRRSGDAGRWQGS